MLHRRPVAPGAQSLVNTPIALNGARKTDKLEVRIGAGAGRQSNVVLVAAD